MFASLIVAVDGSEPSNAAIDLATTLARSGGSSIVLCHVIQLPRPVHDAAGFAREEMLKEETQAGHAVLDAGEQRAASAGVKVAKVIQTGSVAEGILAEARQRGCDAVVIGSRGHSGIARAFAGGATMDLISRSDIPVIVAPHKRA